MAIPVNTGFNVGAPVSIDGRMILTKAEMLNIDDNIMPEVYFAVCKDDGVLYVYNKNMELDKVSEVTGKFKPASEDEIEEVFNVNKIRNYEVASMTDKSYFAIADENGENKKVPLNSLSGYLKDQNNLVSKDYVDSRFNSIMNIVGKTFNVTSNEDGTFNEVIYAINKIIAASTSNECIIYSEDNGETWNNATFVNDLSDLTGDMVQCVKIKYLYSKVFAVIEHVNAKYLYTSTDGINFTNTHIVLDDLIEKNNILYYVTNTFVFYTTDGNVWNNASVLKNLEPVNNFIIEDINQTILLTEDAWSDDGGYVWNAFKYIDPVTGIANEVAVSYITKIVEVHNLNLWLAILSTGGMWYSNDAKVWQDCEFNANIEDYSKEITDICISDNILIASNYDTNAEKYRPIYSVNGKEWLLCSMYDKDGVSTQYLEGAEGIGKVTYNGTIFVYGGAEYYSNDGRSWYPTTLETNILAYDYDHPIYENGVWVACPNTRLGVSGPIIKSTDGKTWSMNDSALSGSIGDLMFEYGIFLARTITGSTKTLYYSLNGLTWNECTFDSTYNITQNPVFNGSMWVMVTLNESSDVTFLYSVDGMSWNYAGTQSDYRVDYQKNPVWIGNAWLFIVKNKTTGSSKVITSRDSINWSDKRVSGPDIEITDNNNYSIIVYLQKKVFLTSISKQQTWYSEDKAASFYLCKKNTVLEINYPNVFIEFNNGKYYSMNKNNPYNVIQSSDGAFWSTVDALGTSINPDDFSIVFKNINNGAVAFNNKVFYTLDNGTTWNTSDMSTTELFTITCNSDKFLISSETTLKYSYDGSTWADVTTDVEIESYVFIPQWNGKTWITFAVDVDGNNVILKSDDAINWTNVTNNSVHGGANSDLEWINNIWVATGETGIAYSEDSINWKGSNLILNDEVIESTGYENIYVNENNGIILLYSSTADGFNSGIAIANNDNSQTMTDKVLEESRSIDLTQAEYDAIPEEQRSKTNPYNCYDTGRIYKNGVLYGEKKSEIFTLEEYEALEEAGLVEEDKDYIIKSNEEGSPLFDAKYIKYDNTISGNKSKNVQGAIDNLETEKLDKEYITGITDANNAIGENGVNIFVMSASSENIPLPRTSIIRSYTTIEDEYIRVNQEYSTIDNSPQSGGTYKRYGSSDDGGVTFTWSNWNLVGNIDDSTTDSLKTWSSSKIASEIGGKVAKTLYRGSQSIDINTTGKLTFIFSSEYASQAGCYMLLSNFNSEPLLIELGRKDIGQFKVTATRKSNGVDTITVTTGGDAYSWFVLQF